MNNVKRIFFTGVTGFVGQFLAVELLKADYFLIFLARGKGGLTAEERVSSALAFADTDVYIKYRYMYEVVEGSLDNIPEVEADEIYHVAGSTSFAEAERDEIFRTNLQGTEKILELAEKIRSSALHYISTAYVCNPSQPVAYEKPANCFTTFNNPYAQSKCLAEQAVLEFGEKNHNCKIFIYRPSIIVGRSWDGHTNNFLGYYRYMETFFRLGNAIMIKKNVFKDEIINLPIWVPGNFKADINIVNIDYIVDIMMLIRKKNIPGIYHLTNSNPPTYGWLLEKGLQIFNISGPSPLQDPAKTPENLKKLERGIAKGAKEYIAFVTAKNRFDVSRVRYVLNSDYYSHPIITSEAVQTLLKFAIRCEFKREKALSPRTNAIFGRHPSPLSEILNSSSLLKRRISHNEKAGRNCYCWLWRGRRNSSARIK